MEPFEPHIAAPEAVVGIFSSCFGIGKGKDKDKKKGKDEEKSPKKGGKLGKELRQTVGFEQQEELLKPKPEKVNPYKSMEMPKGFGKSERVKGNPELVREKFEELWTEKVINGGTEYSEEELEGLKSDYKAIMNLLLSKRDTESAWSDEEHGIESMLKDDEAYNPNDVNDPNKRHLGKALLEQEKAHGFSANQSVPMGILPGDVFLQEIGTKGMVPKDIGAGIAHGESSHRLQWSAIMSKYDRDQHSVKDGHEPDHAWSHAPIELLAKMSEPQFGWLQSHLMDVGGNAKNEGYRRPDSVTSRLGYNTSEPTKNAVPLLSHNVGKRFEKRQEMAWNNMDLGLNENQALQKGYLDKKQSSDKHEVVTGEHDKGTYSMVGKRAKTDEPSLQDRIQEQKLKHLKAPKLFTK